MNEASLNHSSGSTWVVTEAGIAEFREHPTMRRLRNPRQRVRGASDMPMREAEFVGALEVLNGLVGQHLDGEDDLRRKMHSHSGGGFGIRIPVVDAAVEVFRRRGHERVAGRITMDQKQLLVNIARCTELRRAEADPQHPCHDVVAVQDPTVRQVPEPWSGHLGTARLLFVSSNPSLDEGEPGFPTTRATDEELAAFFQDRFPAGDVPRVRYWRGVAARARELYEDAVDRPVAGVDWAITEIVHCKSRSEVGVKAAADHCADLYLDRVLAISPAPVVVVIGSEARDIVKARLGEASGPGSTCRASLGGRSRLLVFLPHPSSYGTQRAVKVLTPEELTEVRTTLGSDMA